MPNKNTITVDGCFREKQVTKEEFIKTWSDYINGLKRLNYEVEWMDRVNVIKEEVENKAATEFDKTFALQNA